MNPSSCACVQMCVLAASVEGCDWVRRFERCPLQKRTRSGSGGQNSCRCDKNRDGDLSWKQLVRALVQEFSRANRKSGPVCVNLENHVFLKR